MMRNGNLRGCATEWLGWQDSNLRMAIPKTAALPLGYTPTLTHSIATRDVGCNIVSFRNKDIFHNRWRIGAVKLATRKE